MWKEIGKLILRFTGVVAIAVLILMAVAKSVPFMRYMDGEYAMYRQNADYARKTEAYAAEPDPKTLILGDSRTKAGMIPELLGTNTYNMALGGSTPVETYYIFKEYLEHHAAPEYVLIAFAPSHYEYSGTFWSRTMYFHTMRSEDAMEIFQTAESVGDTEFAKEHYRLHYLMYKFYAPNKYGAALRRSIGEDRFEKNVKMYVECTDAKGQHYFGTAKSITGVVEEAQEKEFHAGTMEKIYMQKLLDLCKEHGCKAIVESMPFSLTSYRLFAQEYKDAYNDYMTELAVANPEVSVYNYFYCYDDTCFGDESHLNASGAEAYSLYIRERYPYAFP
ncbi:MAG: hypothetical protein K6G07_07330 [Lachnospiraceae bacterium]|nr:hypothetical protein [Lachnospiraceae bacterium]